MDLDPIPTESANLEAELEEVREERSRELSRPMRGAERDQLRRKYERLEARIRERLAAIRGDPAPAEEAPTPTAHQTAETSIFDEQAARYDAWYDTPAGAAAFAEEVGALQPMLAGLPRPWLEVGVGTGRFARALGVEFGVDPAPGALRLALPRGIEVAAARGEALPFRNGTFGAVLLVVTLCFVADPLATLLEARRVLRRDGGVVLGLVLAEGPLGVEYRAKAAEGHPYYREAHFFTRGELASLLTSADLQAVRTRSALLVSPELSSTGIEPSRDPPRDGDDPRAGFTAILSFAARGPDA